MFYFIADPQGGEGKGRRFWMRVQRKLGRILPQESYEVFLVEKAGDAREFAKQISAKDPEQKLLIVVGDARTLNEAVDGSRLDADDVVLGYLPCEDGQGYARLPRRSRSLGKRLKRIFSGEGELRRDYGVLDAAIGHCRFVTNAGIGFDAAFLDKQEFIAFHAPGKGRFFHFWNFRYAALFLRELWRAGSCGGYVLLDGEKRLEFRHLYFVSAFVHLSDRPSRRKSSAEDGGGSLEICIVNTRHRSRLLRFLFSEMKETHRGLAGAHYYRCKSVFAHFDEPMPVYTDGMFCGTQQEISLHCVPQKLRLRV